MKELFVPVAWPVARAGDEECRPPGLNATGAVGRAARGDHFDGLPLRLRVVEWVKRGLRKQLFLQLPQMLTFLLPGRMHIACPYRGKA